MTSLILHTLEAQSVRVSAHLDARPELGALWRRMVAVSEASANLSMEDTPVPEQDILMPDLGSAMVTGDPQSAQIARAIHSFLIRPGNILDSPAEVFDRARDAGRMTSIADEQDGGRIPQLSAAEKMDWDWARRDFELLTRQILRHEAPVVFRLLAFSGAVSQILPERSPIMERLIFMAAESTLRRQESLSDLTVGFMTRDTDTRISAHWTMTPATALSRGGFRAWSPASPSGETELAERLLSALKFNVGRLGQIHKWMAEINKFKGKTRKSRHQDLAQLMLICPIISADVAASRLGITTRATRDLIDEASQQGLLQLMTPRRNYRLWAIPTLAEMIRDKPHSGKSRSSLTSLKDRDATKEPGPGHNLPQNEEALRAAEEELDRAMAHADRILARFRKDVTPQE